MFHLKAYTFKEFVFESPRAVRVPASLTTLFFTLLNVVGFYAELGLPPSCLILPQELVCIGFGHKLASLIAEKCPRRPVVSALPPRYPRRPPRPRLCSSPLMPRARTLRRIRAERFCCLQSLLQPSPQSPRPAARARPRSAPLLVLALYPPLHLCMRLRLPMMLRQHPISTRY